MSRLAPAIRIRRRALDRLRFAIGAELQQAVALGDAASGLASRRHSERIAALSATVPSDPWFAAAARRMAMLEQARIASAARLSTLRHEVGEAQGRLRLLEQAAENAAATERRKREKAAQARLDDFCAGRRSRW